MTIFTRLEQWADRGTITPEQKTLLAGLARGEPFSLYLELNILLYAGILAFVGGLGWTISTWSEQMGDVVVLTLLSALLAACLWHCFTRAPAWSPAETASPSLVFDYVLYLGALIWSVELAYIENRFRMLSGQWDIYLLATSALFFFLAYRFDNRFVLSLALSSLAAWFGFTVSQWPPHQDAGYRQYAIVYSLLVSGAGSALERRGLKPHFLGAYLNISANVLFWALLSGVFDREHEVLWLLCLLAVCGASLAWGITRRQFPFVAYAAVYGYVGVSAVLVRDMNTTAGVLSYFVFTGVAMLVVLVWVARRFARES